jgi:signal transduction histidine kinase
MWATGAAAILAGASLGLVTAGDAQTATPTDVALAAAAVPLVAPLLTIVVSRAPLAWIALAGGVVGGPLHAGLYDPFVDPDCARLCAPSPLVLTRQLTLAQDARSMGLVVTGVAITLLAVRSRRRWQVAIVAVAAWAVAIDTATDLLLVAAATILLALAVDLVDRIKTRREIRELARRLGTTGEAQETLRRELRDPDLAVSFWLEEERRFVAADGTETARPSADQESTEVRVDGILVARVCHDRRAAIRELAEALDGRAHLALDNERLGAQVAVQLAALRESRARIVERADATRRDIERDIHDGAQQHVLALGLELTVALAKLHADDPRRAVVERCIDETNTVLDELRDLSHGIFPSSLEAGGLAHGLRTLSAQSRRPLRVLGAPADRFRPALERAAFHLVADAADRAEGPLDVLIDANGDVVNLTVIGTSPTGGVVADRVAAAGGTVLQEGDTIVATFPCAS